MSALASQSTVGKQLQLPLGQIGLAGHNEFPQFFGLARRKRMESGFTSNARGSRWRRRSKGCRRDPTFGQAGQSGLRARWTTQNGQTMTTSTCLKPMRHPWTLSGSVGRERHVAPPGGTAVVPRRRGTALSPSATLALGAARHVVRLRRGNCNPERSVECAAMPQCGFSRTDTQTCRSDLILVCSPSCCRWWHMVFHCFVGAQPVVWCLIRSARR